MGDDGWEKTKEAGEQEPEETLEDEVEKITKNLEETLNVSEKKDEEGPSAVSKDSDSADTSSAEEGEKRTLHNHRRRESSSA